jgi:hypothetical protein
LTGCSTTYGPEPATHFGITPGYDVLYFKVSDTRLNRTFTVKQTMHDPLAGIGGIYF